ncbi:hypothetical protein BU25DRAFT_219261 [Macroventuria anomochaeta]|uniref:Uncharacterized protein n=1 Tax=Macroventuria anomochaeta TaxID=301207 RepID=A0ACB6RJ60_9PLEO|nr:uncharacterized protein BU25DRAFT_219261 [Macroventuria anomochaeta]KAF2621945.1 hypothetical protein BU25DRAFT_219261 [Macroventuria anomochaeta]
MTPAPHTPMDPLAANTISTLGTYNLHQDAPSRICHKERPPDIFCATPNTSLYPIEPTLPDLPPVFDLPTPTTRYDSGFQASHESYSPYRQFDREGLNHTRPLYSLVGAWEIGPDLTCSRLEATSDATQDDNDVVEVQQENIESAVDTNARPLPMQDAAKPASQKKRYSEVVCKTCGQGFAGQYGPGNLKRHVLQMHSITSRRGYSCRVCKKFYNRSDALRCHEQQKHPGLAKRPKPRIRYR